MSSVYVVAGECLSGALQWGELLQLALDIGFAPPILVKSVTFTSNKDAVSQLLGACTTSGDELTCSS